MAARDVEVGAAHVDVVGPRAGDEQDSGVTVEGELGCLGSLETMKGDKEDGHGTDSRWVVYGNPGRPLSFSWKRRAEDRRSGLPLRTRARR